MTMIDWTAGEIKTLFYEELGACGCSELDTMIEVVCTLLEWSAKDALGRPSFDALYSHVGIFYLLAGQLDRLELIEHGVSIRASWITEKGETLLHALKTMSVEDIDEADSIYG